MKKIILALLFVSVTGLYADETSERCKVLAHKLNIAIEQFHEVRLLDPCAHHDAVIKVLQYSRTLKSHCMDVMSTGSKKWVKDTTHKFEHKKRCDSGKHYKTSTGDYWFE